MNYLKNFTLGVQKISNNLFKTITSKKLCAYFFPDEHLYGLTNLAFPWPKKYSPLGNDFITAGCFFITPHAHLRPHLPP
jgi:hypothetical protein